MQDVLQPFIKRVEAFEIDPGDKVLGFAERLARENRWSVDYSQRVIREYKRFCILAMISGHAVTPSEAVDQAWHLHLTYTRSYWERFCGETLGKPLHHQPTAGGASEGVKFHDWYSETLNSYERLFGEKPPGDVWPGPDERFRHAGQWAWINTGCYWIIPRACVWPIVATVLLVALMLLPGCVPAIAAPERSQWFLTAIAGSIFPFSLGGNGFLLFYGSLCSVGLAVILSLRIASKTDEVKRQPTTTPDLSVDELAVLSGGGMRLAYVSLARLYRENRIDATKPGWFSGAKLIAKPITEPIESNIDRDLYAEIKKGTAMSGLLRTIKPHYERINQKLIGIGLRNESQFHSRSALVIIGSIFILGIVRLIQGYQVGEEIGLLVIMTLFFPVIGIRLNRRQAKVTLDGENHLNRCKEKLTSEQSIMPSDLNDAVNSGSTLMGVALLGTVAIDGLAGFGAIAPVLQKMNVGSSGGGCGAGCGTGCGGGDGGGGCGGCGGCGG